MEAIIFCGIQGSGKSTFYLRHFYPTHVRLNLDMLHTRHREAILLHACLAAQQPFVIDNTNATIAKRARYISLAKAAGFRVPRTIVSQDPEEIRGFCHAHQTIVKPVLGTRKTGLLTRLVTERHLSSDEAMMVAPAM